MDDLTTHARYKEARRHARNVRGWYVHALVYVFVIGGLLVLNLLQNPGRLWVGWSAFGWGIGLLAHGLSVFAGRTFLGTEWEEQKIREYLEKRA
ncbi:hypothetical protein BWI17_04885 [Betaproteobacteria bacterium GR16-43]|nr:hypothetical protein BWI17_04885 [Betaproteobacteria bacterium GR16-43]